MDKHLILGVHVTDRLQNAPRVQQLLSEHGCHIKTRLGLHEPGPEGCGPNGLLLLELRCAEHVADELAAKLNAVQGVEVQKMAFGHPR